MATQLKKTVKPSGGDYTTLEACMNANEQNLVTADKYFDVEIDGDWSSAHDTSAVTIHNYTCDSTRYINIYTTAAARHAGKWSDSKYISAQNGTTCLTITNVTSIRITGLQFELTMTGSAGYRRGIYVTLADTQSILIDTCIVKIIASDTSANTSGIKFEYAASGTRTAYVRNSIVFDCVNGSTTTFNGIEVNSGWTANVDNCTAHNCYYGFRGLAGTHNITNFGAASCTNGIVSTPAAVTSSTSTPTFVDEAGDDFHLASSDTTWKNQGTDLSATFTKDIDGETRPTGAGTWDIGADEYVAAGGGLSIPLVMDSLGTYQRIVQQG